MKMEKMMNEIFTRRDFNKAALWLAGILLLTGQTGNSKDKSINDVNEKEIEDLKKSAYGHWCIPH